MNLRKWIIDPHSDRQRAGLAELQELAIASAFAEVTRAKHHHDGLVGINVLRKIGLPIPATIYGAMLAGVDVVLTGAGSPDEMPSLLDALARHEEGALSVKVLRAAPGAEHATRFAPAELAGLPTGAPLRRPRFLAIVASVDLAAGLAARPATRPDGFVVEGPTAGGHNAPPRGPWRPQTDPSYAAVWVQSDLGAIERRNTARVAAGETNPSVVARWMREEFPFVAEERPWERALLVVAGTPELPHDPSTEVVLAPSPSRR